MEQDWRKEFIASANEYVKETNQYLGVMAFTIGIACIGKPSGYAWLALFFLPYIWYSRFESYKNRLEALRAIDYEIMRPATLLPKCIPAFVGWMFLGSVAIGIVK
ncbi:MAG: hypothetical protein FD134_1985 [Gallionellaceae bacterium]|nr:MAG: hypothetical protein FD134_1985 [Gallionellaceae bacterium]